ncbi:GAP family protein [Rhodococcus tibetensis]|uniref:GAP family protein n=1 Tax=Rhodococcus tibetensis TaxID=2965064 RepID=A0ABT1QHH4_9NOCA|nr:GAP family protein [Rhodococcus sp. FXJ9.536]MCQ4121734.1 GAP family protein [Rhodococcus sp. FXJ9.536]
MGSVIGEMLPLAVGVAISPIPIIAVILMLLSKRAGGASAGFGVGWIAGILVATGIVVLLAGGIDTADSDGPSATTSWVKVVLGVLLLLLAGRQWRGRNAHAEPPKWMQAIDDLSFVKSIGFGFVLAAVNPKNLLLCVSAGVVIGSSGVSGGEQGIALVVFTVLAGSTVLVPVVAYAVAADKMRGTLDNLKVWLQANNAAVMSVLLLVMGAVVLGKGLGGAF